MTANTQSHSANAQSLDAVLALLRDPRRRDAVAALSDRRSAVSLDALARAVAARETATDPAAVSEPRVERVARQLHHVHLPKLADDGVVTYDAESGTVAPARTEQLTPYLEIADDEHTDGSSETPAELLGTSD